MAAVLGDGGAGGEAAEEMFSQVAKPSSANLRSSDPAVLLGMVEVAPRPASEAHSEGRGGGVNQRGCQPVSSPERAQPSNEGNSVAR